MYNKIIELDKIGPNLILSYNPLINPISIKPYENVFKTDFNYFKRDKLIYKRPIANFNRLLEKISGNYFYYLKIMPNHNREDIGNLIIQSYGGWYVDGRKVESFENLIDVYYFDLLSSDLSFDESFTLINSLEDIYINDKRRKEIKLTNKERKKSKSTAKIGKTSVKSATRIFYRLRSLNLKDLNYILKEKSINDWTNKKEDKVELILKNLEVKEIEKELLYLKKMKSEAKEIKNLLNKFNNKKLIEFLNKINPSSFNNAFYIDKKSSEIIDKIIQILPYKQFNSFKEEINQTLTNQVCKVCGKKIENYSKSETCRDCRKKIHACTILINLKELVGTVEFNKEDLEKMGYSDMEANDTIWTLQENDLVFPINNNFKLEKKEIIESYIEKWGKYVDPNKLKHNQNKLSKTCKACGITKKITEFHKSGKTKDGYGIFCKNCDKKIKTTKNLLDLLNYIKPEEKFKLEDLRQYYQEEFVLLGIIYNLQENDLINEENGTYSLKSKDILDKFINKWIMFTEEDNIKEELLEENISYNFVAKEKAPAKVRARKQKSKACSICGEESYDDVCPSCKNKIHACKLINTLIDEIDYELPFRKDDLIDVGYNKIEVMDVIWTLEENKLLFRKNNQYLLANIKTIDSFIDKWEEYIED